jgi:hypothetical protein
LASLDGTVLTRLKEEAIDMDCRILGTTDTAIRLGCSAEYVRQLERAGKLPAEKMPNGRRVFKAEDVERLATQRKEQKRAKQTAGSNQV